MLLFKGSRTVSWLFSLKKFVFFKNNLLKWFCIAPKGVAEKSNNHYLVLYRHLFVRLYITHEEPILSGSWSLSSLALFLWWDIFILKMYKNTHTHTRRTQPAKVKLVRRSFIKRVKFSRCPLRLYYYGPEPYKTEVGRDSAVRPCSWNVNITAFQSVTSQV